MRIVRCAAVVLLATFATLVAASPAAAMAPVRRDIALAAAQRAGDETGGPAPDMSVVQAIYGSNGVNMSGIASASDLEAVASHVDATPAPADLATFFEPRPTGTSLLVPEHEQVAIFLTGTRLLVNNPLTHRLEIHLRAELSGIAASVADGPPIARPDTLRAWRLPPSRWPGGNADASPGAGRVALTNPAATADDLAWMGGHPRDADISLTHVVVDVLKRLLIPLALLLLTVVAVVADGVARAPGLLTELLHHLGFAGSVILTVAGFVGSFLATSFDGRGLHVALRVVAVIVAVLLFPAIAIPLLAVVAAGWLLQRLGVPVLGSIGGAVWGAFNGFVGVVITTFTGVEGDTRTSLFAVFIAVLSAPVTWLRPLFAATRLRRVVALATTAGDLVSLRPRGWRVVITALMRRRGIAVADFGVAASRTPQQWRALVRWRAWDLASLAWRPRSVAGDLTGLATEMLTGADASLRAGATGAPMIQVRRLLMNMDPGRRDAVLSCAALVSRRAVPLVSAYSAAGKTHSGAVALTAWASGSPHIPVSAAPPVARSMTVTPPRPPRPRPGPGTP